MPRIRKDGTEAKPSGFSLLTQEQRTAMGKIGGLAAQGKGHKWSVEEARAASVKAQAVRRAKRASK